MDQLIPGLATLIASFRDCFRSEVFQTFQALIAGFICTVVSCNATVNVVVPVTVARR